MKIIIETGQYTDAKKFEEFLNDVIRTLNDWKFYNNLQIELTTKLRINFPSYVAEGW